MALTAFGKARRSIRCALGIAAVALTLGSASDAFPVDDSATQLRMGLMHYYGQGVPEDEAQAMAWLKKSAAQGNLDAMYHIGNILTFGIDAYRLSSDPDVEGARWYFDAARSGHADAQYALGLMFLSGKGVVQSREEGLAWIRSAAAQGHAEAEGFVGVIDRNTH